MDTYTTPEQMHPMPTIELMIDLRRALELEAGSYGPGGSAARLLCRAPLSTGLTR